MRMMVCVVLLLLCPLRTGMGWTRALLSWSSYMEEGEDEGMQEHLRHCHCGCHLRCLRTKRGHCCCCCVVVMSSGRIASHCLKCEDEAWMSLSLSGQGRWRETVMRVDRLTSRSMILTLREVLTKRHCVLKGRLRL